jgi:hypothetical protein
VNCGCQTSRCDGRVIGSYQLAGRREPVQLCASGLQALTAMGYDPSPTPEWVLRAYEKRLPAKRLDAA